MRPPLTLFSTCATLAYGIAQTYYDGLHYAWCAPARGQDGFFVPQPPSSDPIDIYWTLYNDIDRNDRHSAKIEGLRQGIIRGADSHLRRGTITAAQREEIALIATQATLADFKPLMMVMPHALVEPYLRPAPIESRASVLSIEYIAENLPRSHFELLKLEQKR
ncbi:MAG TPA: hypothetical protein VGE72_26950 [Azospirillum sp.]